MCPLIPAEMFHIAVQLAAYFVAAVGALISLMLSPRT
jgi:hypothetical protein